jgi:hypothetical protein
LRCPFAVLSESGMYLLMSVTVSLGHVA